MLASALLQFPRGGLRRFRRWRPDIDEDEVDGLRKSRVKRDLLLPPRQFGGKEIVDVGINREVTRRVDR